MGHLSRHAADLGVPGEAVRIPHSGRRSVPTVAGTRHPDGNAGLRINGEAEPDVHWNVEAAPRSAVRHIHPASHDSLQHQLGKCEVRYCTVVGDAVIFGVNALQSEVFVSPFTSTKLVPATVGRPMEPAVVAAVGEVVTAVAPE